MTWQKYNITIWFLEISRFYHDSVMLVYDNNNRLAIVEGISHRRYTRLSSISTTLVSVWHCSFMCVVSVISERLTQTVAVIVLEHWCENEMWRVSSRPER